MSKIRMLPAPRALTILALAVAAGFAAPAGATTLNIDSTQSQVTYTPGSGVIVCPFEGNIDCPAAPTPQTASLSGQIELDVVHEHFEIRGNIVDRDLIFLTNRNFSAGPLSAVFPLSGAVGILSGKTFQVSDNPCFLSPDEQCSWSGWNNASWGATGSWDGTKLVWQGWSSESMGGDSLSYTINAQIAAVPEPSAAVLFGLGLLTFVLRRRRGDQA